MSHLYPEDLQPLRKYDYIPDTYKNYWEDYNLFVPRSMVKSFNRKVYYNFIQRECFNSCIQSSDLSVSDEERSCFNNCRSKHLSSLGLYEKITLARRKWNGILDFVNLYEFNKKPENMGHLVPTDPILLSTLDFHTVVRRNALQSSGFASLFNTRTFGLSPNLFEFYKMGYQPETSNAYVRDNKPTFVPHKVYRSELGNTVPLTNENESSGNSDNTE